MIKEKGDGTDTNKLICRKHQVQPHSKDFKNFISCYFLKYFLFKNIFKICYFYF
jgi:hypothetical protein